MNIPIKIMVNFLRLFYTNRLTYFIKVTQMIYEYTKIMLIFVKLSVIQISI